MRVVARGLRYIIGCGAGAGGASPSAPSSSDSPLGGWLGGGEGGGGRGASRGRELASEFAMPLRRAVTDDLPGEEREGAPIDLRYGIGCDFDSFVRKLTALGAAASLVTASEAVSVTAGGGTAHMRPHDLQLGAAQ